MSERRRYSLVLLLVLALMGGAIYVVLTKPTVLGLDLQGGVQLVYHAEPTAAQKTVDADSMQRSIDLLQQRVNQFGVSEAEINQAGSDQIEVGLPGVKDAERAAQQVGSTAQLFFYDWEANILDESCKTNPDENASEKSPITGFYKAVKQASKCPAENDNNNNAADAPRFYAFDKTSKQPLNDGQPSDSKKAALEGLTPQQRANAEVVEVPTGILVSRDEKPNAKAPDPDRWWVIQDTPAL